MSRSFIYGLLVTLVLFVTGCGGLDDPTNEKIVGGEIIADFHGDSIKSSMIASKTPGIDENTTVYGYSAYKIPYTTTDEEGNSIKVSGLMVVPKGLPEVVYNKLGLSLVSDSHGTIFSNNDAPTVEVSQSNAPAGSSIILTSLGGFVTIQADYIGFGDSAKHYHPFVLKKSLANATVDFIKAARRFAEDNDINLNDQLFLTGYSEGGYASMATLQKIEEEEELTVSVAAPMAGPYAFEAMAMGVLKEGNLSVPSFMANVGYAYAKAYKKDITTVINKPFASSLDKLLDGSKDRAYIDSQLTLITTGDNGLFNSLFVNEFFTVEHHWFKKATQENNLHNWAPNSPVRLLHCKGDDVIPYAISQLTKETMEKMGAPDVAIYSVETALGLPDFVKIGHSKCGPMAYKVATGIFAQFRKEKVGY